jgi:pyruvate,water dikinase
MVDDDFHVVQSRPITTLFPIPEAGDRENHVYVSVGHQQMMTDPMKLLEPSVWQLTTPRPMNEAGGRRFVDFTQILASPASRGNLLGLLGKSDPLIGAALQTILDRGDFIPSLSNDGPAWAPPGAGSTAIETDPAIVAGLIARAESFVAELKRDIRTKTGSELLDLTSADILERKQSQSDPRSMQVSHGGDGGHMVAQRPPASVAGREERCRPAHTVGSKKRYVGDGAVATGRRGRHPPAS